MATHRKPLPQLGDRLFLTDGGIETTLIFLDGIELPDFAALPLLERPGRGRAPSTSCGYAEIARQHRTGLVLESAPGGRTRTGERASATTRAELAAPTAGDPDARADARRRSRPNGSDRDLGLRRSARRRLRAGRAMSARGAQEYHAAQVETFAATDADMVRRSR